MNVKVLILRCVGVKSVTVNPIQLQLQSHFLIVQTLLHTVLISAYATAAG